MVRRHTPNGDFDLLQGVGGRDGPVAAECQPGARSQERRKGVLPGTPLLAQEGHVHAAHLLLVQRPVGLSVGDDAQSREARDVDRVHDLDVRQRRPPIPGRVDGGGALDGIEGIADGAVTDGVDVHVQARPVDQSDRLPDDLDIE